MPDFCRKADTNRVLSLALLGLVLGCSDPKSNDGPKDNIVFNAATIWWANGLSSPPGHVHPSRHGVTQQGPDKRVQQITCNLFTRMIS